MNTSLTQEIETLAKEKTPYLFMAAAVSDYIPKSTQIGKLKKELLGKNFNLELTKGIDILESVNKEGLITIGFKAEMDVENAHSNASEMLSSKKVDAVCLNILQDSSSFGSDTNKVEFISAQKQESIASADKLSVAFEILKHAQEIS
jgi:phosphopantothenoylcysteine decarboxylase/phosphopantothenate--cysteine ligase